MSRSKVGGPMQLESVVAEGFAMEQFAQFQPPLSGRVGFDVDDSLIFSAPAFNAVRPQYDAHVVRPMRTEAVTWAQAETGPAKRS